MPYCIFFTISKETKFQIIGFSNKFIYLTRKFICSNFKRGMKTENMAEKSIRRNLYRVLRKTGVTRENICLSASFIEDLNFDHIDWTIFTFYLEKVFNIAVKDEKISTFRRVDDTLHYLRNELSYSK